MKLARCGLIAALLTLVLTTGCNQPGAPAVDGTHQGGGHSVGDGPSSSQSAPAVPPTETHPGSTNSIPSAPAVTPPAAAKADSLFPDQDLSPGFMFDDGTPDVQEELLRDGNRVIALQNGQPYATWHLRPDGLYRRDPLGGESGALLRYLPAELQDNLSWTQRSGDAQIHFHLHQSECYTTSQKTACWEVSILNRSQLQWFRFAPGMGAVAASVLDTSQRAASYHKNLRATPIQQGHADAAERQGWLKQAPETWSDQAAPPVLSYSPILADRDMEALLAARGTAVDLGGDGHREYLLGPLDTWGSTPVIMASGTQWQRTCTGECRVRLVQQPVPWLVVEQRGQGDLEVFGWAGLNQGYLYGWEPKSERTTGRDVTIASDGTVTVVRDLGDPMGHVETRTFVMHAEAGRSGYLERLSSSLTPPDKARYPTTPRDVLAAAAFTVWYELPQERVPFFATDDARLAMESAALEKSAYGWPACQVEIGKLNPLEQPSPEYPPQKLTPASVGTDGWADFELRAMHYEASDTYWGRVHFVQNAQGRWQIDQWQLKQHWVGSV